MPLLEREIDANQGAFFSDWTAAASHNWNALKGNEVYTDSYRRLTALQAIKAHLIVPHYSPGSAAFFFEAHNDALVSHVAAATGAWRSALQSLRSCIENVLCAIYYNEHPIELELWEGGQFRIGVTDLIRYMERHPHISALGTQLTGLEAINGEYATLSKAVHASAVNFRMTDSASTVLLWSADPIQARMWSTREKRTVEGLSLLMVCLHKMSLEGTKLTPLRNVLRFSIGTSKRRGLRKRLLINIPES